MSDKNYYKIIGVSSSATPDEIRSAYRKIATKNHPDKNLGLPDDERKSREDKWLEVNEAYQVLSDVKKRKKYDEGIREGRTYGPEGKQSGVKSNFTPDDIFFGTDSILGSILGTNRQITEDMLISIPENDWALLAALTKAYGSKEDGKWRVRVPETDKRDWMPKELYSVVKEKGQVTIFRSVTDWRNETDRSQDIHIREDPSTSVGLMTVGPNSFLNEYYFGSARNLLYEFHIIPTQYDSYLNSMKKLAKKIIRGDFEVSMEIASINTYTQDFLKTRTRRKGENIVFGDENREWVCPIHVDLLMDKMAHAEKYVIQKEGNIQSKEGQRLSTHTSSSESKS